MQRRIELSGLLPLMAVLLAGSHPETYLIKGDRFASHPCGEIGEDERTKLFPFRYHYKGVGAIRQLTDGSAELSWREIMKGMVLAGGLGARA